MDIDTTLPITAMHACVSEYVVEILPLDALLPSEDINEERAIELAKRIEDNGFWTRPILVEKNHNIIMDGHHRRFAARLIRLARVPCVQLSYEDSRLEVGSWVGSDPFPKSEIINAGLTGNLLGFKTTRHRLEANLPKLHIALSELG